MLVSDSVKALEIVKALSDEYSRKIVLSITDRSLPIEEISKQQGIPISTCYRRAKELEVSGIIKPDKTIIEDNGKKYITYKCSFKNATIELGSGELKVDLVASKDPAERLQDMWSSIRNDEQQEEVPHSEAALAVLRANGRKV